MNADDLLIPILKWLAAALAGLGIWQLRKHDDKLNQMHLEFSDYKLEAEKRFAKDETMQSSLSRIHDRIDLLPEQIAKIMEKRK